MKKINIKFEYSLEGALMLYRRAPGYSYNQEKMPYYVELHNVYDKDGQSVLGAGIPLSEKAAAQLAASLSNKKAKRHAQELLPDNLLSCDMNTGRYTIWYEKATRRLLQFSEGLGIQDRVMHVPAMLFVRHFGLLRAFALDSDERPTATTRLYHAPFHNVKPWERKQGTLYRAEGQVCLGNAVFKRETQSLTEEIAEYSKGFWLSRFSAVHNTKAVPEKKTLAQVWRSRVRATNPYPTNYLIPNGFTLGDLVKTL
jgi:PRTRC genetic system protein B